VLRGDALPFFLNIANGLLLIAIPKFYDEFALKVPGHKVNGHGFNFILHRFKMKIFYHSDNGHKLIRITPEAGLNKPGIQGILNPQDLQSGLINNYPH